MSTSFRVAAVVLAMASMAAHASDLGIKVPPPPADAPEIPVMLAKKALRSPDIVQQIKDEAVDPTPMFWATAGLVAVRCANLNALVVEVQQDVYDTIMPIKAYYHRRRPNAVEPSIDPVVAVPWHAAYPNGHATQSRVMARLFSLARPEASQALLDLATRIGRNREIAGLHYPSDTDAGFALADEIWKRVEPKVKARMSNANCP